MTVAPIDLTAPTPYAGEALLRFFGRHAVAGVESFGDVTDEHGRRISYARTLSLPHGPAALTLTWSVPSGSDPDGPGALTTSLALADASDLDAGRRRVEQLCDLAVDPVEIAGHLRADDRLRPLVDATPGLRVPGVVDAEEHLFRTLIGQQISLAGAASCTAKLVSRYGQPVDLRPSDLVSRELTHLFPTAAALAAADPDTLAMPRARGRALVGLAERLAEGRLVLDPGQGTAEVRARLLGCPGIGSWTADYVLMRGWHEPDILLASDLAVRRELSARGITDTSRWTPWRSYATMHLWRAYLG